MRKMLLWAGIGLVVGACAGDGTGPPPPPPPTKRVLLVSGNNQVGGIKTKLPLPLRVFVDSAGTKLTGATVFWRAPNGSLEPEVGVTNAEGIATTTWTFDTVAGALTASAAVEGLRDTVTFSATALPGPAVSIRSSGGNEQTVGVNAASFELQVRIQDQYGNAAPARVNWTVGNDLVELIGTPTPSPTDTPAEYSRAQLRPTGTQGNAPVRAALAGTAAAVDFTVTVGGPEYVVLLKNYTFVSVQNHTSNPAVDTVPAGTTVVWKLDPFDYDLHRVVSVGTPSFPPTGDFPYGWDSKVAVVFTVAGTYKYTDLYYGMAKGIIVVR